MKNYWWLVRSVIEYKINFQMRKSYSDSTIYKKLLTIYNLIRRLCFQIQWFVATEKHE